MYLDYKTKEMLEEFEHKLLAAIEEHDILPKFRNEYEKYAFLNTPLGRYIGCRALDLIKPGPITINDLVKSDPEFWLQYIDDYDVLYKTTVSDVIMIKPWLFRVHKLPIQKVNGFAFRVLASKGQYVVNKYFDYLITLDKSTIREVCRMYPEITKKFTPEILEMANFSAKDFLLLVTMNESIFDVWERMPTELFIYLKDKILVDILCGEAKTSDHLTSALDHFADRLE